MNSILEYIVSASDFAQIHLNNQSTRKDFKIKNKDDGSSQVKLNMLNENQSKLKPPSQMKMSTH